MKKEKKEKPKKEKRIRKKDREQLLRIEELEKVMQETGGEIDPETLISMYRPRRKIRRFGAALLHLDRMWLILMGMVASVGILFTVAFFQENMGNFTVNLNRLELFRRGISIADNGEFKNATARLTAASIPDAMNISIEDLPGDLDAVEGSHNGRDYMAYTFYLRNAGKEAINYSASLTLVSCAKGAEEAVRVAIWRNGKKTVYAEPSKEDGTPEKGCENFLEHDIACAFEVEDFLVGDVDRYTIVVWMEGDDPECVDAIVGGAVEFQMDFNAIGFDDRHLIWKFIQDVGDTLTGNKPIDSAGVDAPDYMQDKEITWTNRRNKEREHKVYPLDRDGNRIENT